MPQAVEPSGLRMSVSGSQAPVELIIRARITSPAAPLKVKQLIAPALATLATLVVP